MTEQSDSYKAFYEGRSGFPRGTYEDRVIMAMTVVPGANLAALAEIDFCPTIPFPDEAYKIGRALRCIAAFLDQGNIKPKATVIAAHALRNAALKTDNFSLADAIVVLTRTCSPILRSAQMDIKSLADELKKYAVKPVKLLAQF